MTSLIHRTFAMLLFVACYIFSTAINAQEKTLYTMTTVAFWNVENLFDTINSVDRIDKSLPYADPKRRTAFPKSQLPEEREYFVWDTRDAEYTPEGRNGWNAERYRHKLKQLARVIADIGAQKTKQAPAVIGLCEIENHAVLDDLVRQKAIASYNYSIIHFNSPDERGIDVAMLYQPSRFILLEARPVELKLRSDDGERRDYTRDQLVVKGLLDGELFYFIVNHWPSRYGGEQRSAPRRMQAALLCKRTVDEIMQKEPHAKVIIMGDLNDDPINKSITEGLKAKGKQNVSSNTPYLFNTMFKAHQRGVSGTLAYRDTWNLFDQMIVSSNLLKEHKNVKGYTFLHSGIFNKRHLMNSTGSFKNYPFRTMVAGTYHGGFSDHFPVYLHLYRK